MNILKNKKSHIYSSCISTVFTSAVLITVRLKVSRPVLLGERFFPGFGWIEMIPLTVYAVFLTNVMVSTGKIGKWRSFYWRLFSLIFFAQLILGLTVSSSFLMTGNLHLPVPAMIIAGPLYRGRVSFMLFLLVATVMILGPGWCAHLCYIGAWDDIAAKMKKSPVATTPIPKYIRYIILVVIILVSPLLRLTDVSHFTASILGALFGIVGVVVMFLLSFRRGQMIHCTTYCPTGTLVVLMGKISPFRLQIKKSSCNNCGVCGLSCRYGALSDEDIDNGRAGLNCVLCGDCLPSCHERAIKMTFLRSGSDAWPTYISIAVSLHAIFIGLARL